MAEHAAHRAVHYWDADLEAPLCGTAEDYFQWSDSSEDVTCDLCSELLAARHDDGRADAGARGPASTPASP